MNLLKTKQQHTTNYLKKYTSGRCMVLTGVFLYLLLLLASCSKTSASQPDGGSIPSAGNKGKAVTGVVKDTRGNPVAGASKRAENEVIYAFVEGKTDGIGVYVLPGIEWSGRKKYAWKDIPFDGSIYHLRMGMPKAADYDPFAGDANGTVV